MVRGAQGEKKVGLFISQFVKLGVSQPAETTGKKGKYCPKPGEAVFLTDRQWGIASDQYSCGPKERMGGQGICFFEHLQAGQLQGPAFEESLTQKAVKVPHEVHAFLVLGFPKGQEDRGTARPGKSPGQRGQTFPVFRRAQAGFATGEDNQI